MRQIRTSQKPNIKLGMILPAICGIVLGLLAKSGPMTLDHWYYHYFFPIFQRGFAHGLMKALSYLGGIQFIIAFMVVALCYAMWDNKVGTWFLLLLATLGTGMENTLLKWAFQRIRPIDFMLVYEGSLSYPSGHAMISLSLYMTLAFLLGSVYPHRRDLFRRICLLLALAISLSRLGLGVHWPTDIIGGWLFGLAAFYLHRGIWRLWMEEGDMGKGTWDEEDI